MKIDKEWEEDFHKENVIFKIESFVEVIYIYSEALPIQD